LISVFCVREKAVEKIRGIAPRIPPSREDFQSLVDPLVATVDFLAEAKLADLKKRLLYKIREWRMCLHIDLLSSVQTKSLA
jgi:hypothetical protein